MNLKNIRDHLNLCSWKWKVFLVLFQHQLPGFLSYPLLGVGGNYISNSSASTTQNNKNNYYFTFL